MNTLQNMRIFVRVVESGTFTAAANHLGLTTAYVSRSVSDLEAHLRTRLLNRTTRRIALTEAGERYLGRCQQIIAYVEEAEAEASEAHARPSGKLRVHTMSSFGARYVVPALVGYQELHPEVSIQLTLSQRIPDLLEEGFEVSIVLGYGLPDSGLVARPLGSAFSIACAAPSYLAERGLPKTPADLPNHVCLSLMTPGSDFDEWILEGPHGAENYVLPPAPFQANGAEAVAIAVRDGMGIAFLPTYTAMQFLVTGDLLWIMPEYTSQAMTIYALYPSRQYLDAKIRTWLDFLQEQLPQTLSAEQSALRQYARTR